MRHPPYGAVPYPPPSPPLRGAEPPIPTLIPAHEEESAGSTENQLHDTALAGLEATPAPAGKRRKPGRRMPRA
jgi:hypothetical protein